MSPNRLLSLLVCAAVASALGGCGASMQNATTASAVVKHPVRASKGSVEKSAPRK